MVEGWLESVDWGRVAGSAIEGMGFASGLLAAGEDAMMAPEGKVYGW